MGRVIADLSLASGMTYRPLIGQSKHMQHDICCVDMRYVRSEVWITQIYKLRKQDTPAWRSEASGDNNTPFLNPRMKCLYHVNLKYSQVCERGVIVDWSGIVKRDNWFTLFAWLGRVSALIKITIRNSALIIRYCENIITGTLIWIITELDNLEAWTQQTESRLSDCCENVSVSQLWMRHSVRPGRCGLMFQIGMKLHHPQFPLNGRMERGEGVGQENRNYHTNEAWNAKLWPALGPNN